MRYRDLITEAKMSPNRFAQAIAQGDNAGVLVGFEFEVCIPKDSIDRGSGNSVQYTDDIASWLAGKSMSDLVDGIKSKGLHIPETIGDILKIKTSVARDLGDTKIYDAYKSWAYNEFKKLPEYSIEGYLKHLKNILNSSEFEEEVTIEPNNYYPTFHKKYKTTRTLGNGETSNKWVLKDFLLHILKLATGIDFSGDISAESITPEVEKGINNATDAAYHALDRPFDFRINQASIKRFYASKEAHYMKLWTEPGHYYPEFKQKFAEFCTTVLGSNDLTTLLKTKLAFYGRTNNTTPVLKQKLWYYLTPNAQTPPSLYSSGGKLEKYKAGSEFVKDNMKSLLGDNAIIFNRYHQQAKDMTTWYIEPDGSLNPNDDDSAVEIVSPPLAANIAMKSLKQFYSEASKLKLYTSADNGTGLHINVSIPQTLDVVKLALFLGDKYVLQRFGRLDNHYSDSIIRQLSDQVKNNTVSLNSFPQAQQTIKELVDEISGEHTTSINYNGKYVSFRHAGGDYLGQYDAIYQTVGRFIQAMIIASTPNMYKREYMTKLSQMISNNPPQLSIPKQIIKSGKIPVAYTDIVLRLSPENLNKESIANALEHVQEWVNRQKNGRYSSEIVYYPTLKQDPSAKQRILSAKGFASDSLEMFKQLPEYAFYRATFYPIDPYGYMKARNRIEQAVEVDSRAFSIWAGADKAASGVPYAGYINKSDPGFIKSYKALVNDNDRDRSRYPLPE